MPSGPRIRANNVYGTVSDNPLLVGAVSFTSLGLSLLPAVSSAHAVVVLDPKRVFGEPEIVVVTSHLAMGTTATITRGQYSTVAREHPQGTAWAHVPVGPDDYRAIVTSGTRPSNPYEGQDIWETDTDLVQEWNGAAWRETYRDGALATWTPTITQAVNVTFTTTFCVYRKIGRWVDIQGLLVITGAGTAANGVLIGNLPFPLSFTNPNFGDFGTAFIVDSSAVDTITAIVTGGTITTNVQFVSNRATGNVLGTGGGFAAGLANTDRIGFEFRYETTS